MIERLLNNKLVKLLFALSASAFVGLQISTGNRIGIVLNVLVIFVLVLLIEYRCKILNILFKVRSKKIAIVSLSISVLMIIEIALIFINQRINRIFSSLNPLAVEMRNTFTEHSLKIGLYIALVLAGIVMFFFLFAAVYGIISHAGEKGLVLIRQIKDTDKIERWYFIIGILAFFIQIIWIYSLTNVAYTTQDEYDIIFTTDSPKYINTDVFFSLYAPENDVRQPLFALSTMPFAVVAKILAIPLFFLPNAYILVMQLIQVSAFLIMAILLLRMSGIKDHFSRIMFLALYSCTYPSLLYSLVVEQYVASTFILVLTIYVVLYKKKQNVGLLALSLGVLVTNAIIVAYLTFEKKLTTWIHSIIKTVIVFVVMCLFCGKLPTLLGGFSSVKALLRFADVGIVDKTHSAMNKLFQFTHFVENCFIAPKTDIVIRSQNVATFQLVIPQRISIFGISVLCISLVCVIINRKILFAKICGLWVLFSALLLYIIGWGSVENGMILYSLYFCWAFISLVFLLFEKLFEKLPTKLKVIKYIVYSAAFLVLVATNVGGIVDLAKFGIEYYPAG